MYNVCRWLSSVELVITSATSFIVATMNSRDQYEIIGLCKISHPKKQPCRSVWLKKALEMHQSS